MIPEYHNKGKLDRPWNSFAMQSVMNIQVNLISKINFNRTCHKWSSYIVYYFKIRLEIANDEKRGFVLGCGLASPQKMIAN